MNNRIISTIHKYNMLSAGDTVLVGVSGGADSMLLLDFFVKNKDKLNIKVKAAHIEHGIRGKSSLDDAAFVKAYCEHNNIEFHMLSIHAVSEAAAAGLGVEEYSRNRRYAFFESIECDKIATAHNLSDNIETVLFRLVRGTGLKGVCGIPPVRGKIIRPLIEISSDDIRKYCLNHSIAFRTDETNLSNDYSRNKIRNEILPLFSALNNDYENKFAEFISDSTDDYSFIDKCADEGYHLACTDNKLKLDTLKTLDPAVLKRVLSKYFFEQGIHLDRNHLMSVLNLVNKTGKVQIKGEWFAVADSKNLRLARLSESENSFNYITKILNIDEFNEKSVDFYCDYDKINGSVTVRGRNCGDRISPANRGCTKSLKKLFNELSVPVEKRASVGVICDDLGIIGIADYCADERVKTDKNTKRVITIKILAEDN